jgi:hypothetical protein
MKVTFRCDPALIDSLPRPFAARDALPEWLRTMPRTAYSELHGTEIRTVKQCPPFVDAMIHGFILPLPCDVTVADGVLTWDWKLPPLSVAAHPRAPLSYHVPAQLEATPFHAPGQLVVKFNSFWTVELEPGWSLYATHPVNRADLPFRLLTGLVDADRFSDVGILFPAVWTDPGFTGTLPRGTPVAQCFPVPREPDTLICEPFDRDDAERYDKTALALLNAPGVYRKRFRTRRTRLRAQPPAQGVEIEP